MVARVIMWGMFGVAVRGWQLGIEMRPWLAKDVLWVYPCYMAGFGAFGYWLQGLDQRQTAILHARKQELLEKRARKAARDGQGQGQGQV